jgi:Xaa-Pro aminopeptidase
LDRQKLDRPKLDRQKLDRQRLDRLRSTFSTEKVDCLLVSGIHNIRYLTGFTGSNALLLVEPDSATFYTDGRYTTQASQEVRDARIRVPKKGIWQAALARLKSKHNHIGFDASVSFALYGKLREALGEKRMRSVSGVVERLRLVKDEAEIAAIRASCELNSRVLAAVLPMVKVGVTERDLSAEIDYRMRRMGAVGPAFETIVASGERSALPHAHPTARQLVCCEFLLFDHGTMLDGYCSDMTRTVWVGGSKGNKTGCEPGRKARELYATVREAHQQAKEAVRAGVSLSAVDRAARRPIAARGWGKYFSHSTGHGVGLEIHESPRVAAKEKDKLPAGAVITIEPGVYLPGFGGVRIEDMVVVRETGCEVLTPATPSYRELLEIP